MLYRVVAAFVLVAVGIASFYGAHYTRQAFADDPPAPPAFDAAEVARLVAADAAKPQINRVLNNIPVAPHGEEPRTAADDADSLSGAVGGAEGTQIRSVTQPPCNDDNPPKETTGGGDLDYTYPSSWLISLEESVTCGDTVASFTRVFTFANDWEGEIAIRRLRGAVGLTHDASAERVSGVTVGNKKAVHVEPIRTSTGFALGPEVLAVSESWGMTLIEVWKSDNTPTARQVAAVVSGTSSSEE